MDIQTTIGVLLIFFGLGFIAYITFTARKIIERIAKKDSGTMREIIKDLQDDKH